VPPNEKSFYELFRKEDHVTLGHSTTYQRKALPADFLKIGRAREEAPIVRSLVLVREKNARRLRLGSRDK